MSSPPIREGPHEKGYMAALAAHVKLYGSVDETTLHLVAFPPGMTTKPHDSARVMQELAEIPDRSGSARWPRRRPPLRRK